MASQNNAKSKPYGRMTDTRIVYKRQPINPPSKSFISFHFGRIAKHKDLWTSPTLAQQSRYR